MNYIVLSFLIAVGAQFFADCLRDFRKWLFRKIKNRQ